MAGIQLTTGFDLNSASPLDSRSNCTNYTDILTPFEGLITLQKSDGKHYKYVGGAWGIFASGIGATGAKGDTGLTGATGAQGIQGVAGTGTGTDTVTKTAVFTATTTSTNIIHNLVYDSAHDELDCYDSYYGTLLVIATNYTENANKISIDLVGWSLLASQSVNFILYKNIK